MSHVIAVPFVPDLGGHLLAEKRCTYKLAMLEWATELEGTRMFIYLRFRHCRVGGNSARCALSRRNLLRIHVLNRY